MLEGAGHSVFIKEYACTSHKCFFIVKDGALTDLFNINTIGAIKVTKDKPAAPPMPNFDLGNFMNPPASPNDEPLPAEEDENR